MSVEIVTKLELNELFNIVLRWVSIKDSSRPEQIATMVSALRVWDERRRSRYQVEYRKTDAYAAEVSSNIYSLLDGMDSLIKQRVLSSILGNISREIEEDYVNCSEDLEDG